MINKRSLATVGLLCAGMNYAMVRMTSYEPKLQHYKITHKNWRSTTPLRVALISDFHGGAGLWHGEALARVVKNNDVDMVAVVGDHFDLKHEHENTRQGLKKMASAIPTFFVTGNNEEQLPGRERLLSDLRLLGVRVLDHESDQLTLHGQAVSLFGLRDPAGYATEEAWIRAAQAHLKEASDGMDFRVVLSHRPEGIVLYDMLACDLVLSGHSHGGQWQFPLVGGIFAPHQHFFPRYYHGIYQRGKVHPYHLVVGAGMDVHPLVPRLFNRPELVILEIEQEEDN